MTGNVLVIDSETTGLNPLKGDKVIEVAALLYNIEHKTVLQTFSTLLPCEVNPVEHINGIKPAATQQKMSHDFYKQQLEAMANNCDAIIAHNAEFDRGFIKTLEIAALNEKAWVCTKNDFLWGVPLPRKRLQDVCEALGVAYVNAHRAVNDCMFMVDCFNKLADLKDKMTAAIERATQRIK